MVKEMELKSICRYQLVCILVLFLHEKQFWVVVDDLPFAATLLEHCPQNPKARNVVRLKDSRWTKELF